MAAVGCDGGGDADAGPMDAGAPPPDAGPPFTCASPFALTGLLDQTVSQVLDTSMTLERPRDLGLACGNTSAELRWAPQQVVAFEVPAGVGEVAVGFSTINDVTPDNFNVVVQARRDCEEVPEQTFPGTCFEGARPGMEWRSEGAVAATGGETLYFIVTGWTDASTRAPGLVDRGPVQIDFTVQENSDPTLDTAEVVIVDNDVRIDVTGTDPDGNAVGVVMNFYDAAGLLDIYGDGMATELNSVFGVLLDEPPPTGTAWSAGTWLRSVPGDGRTQLGEYLVGVGATMARIRVTDRLNAASEARMVPIVRAAVVGYGETCGATQRCDVGYACDMGTCQPSPEAIAACAATVPANLPAFTDQAVTVSLTGQTGTEHGLFDPLTGCVAASASVGPERVYQVDAMSGPFDLLVTTDLPVTGRNDTFVYVRTDCADPMSELACNDDLAASDPQSAIELRDLAAGTYFVFVEQVQEAGVTTRAHAVDITARPVLAMGAACDDAEVLNRCANGPCAASVCP